MSQKQFYYMLREQSGAETAKEKQQLWKRVAAFYETLPQGYGTKSDQTGKRYYEEMSDAKKKYLEQLFYCLLAASLPRCLAVSVKLLRVRWYADDTISFVLDGTQRERLCHYFAILHGDVPG
jgi:hypothetical protein